MTKSKRRSFHVAGVLLAGLALALFSNAPSYAEIHCAGGHCNCSGDKDCNDMFEHHCAPTGGSCNNDNNTCVCTEAKAVSSGNGYKNHPVLKATPKNKSMSQ